MHFLTYNYSLFDATVRAMSRIIKVVSAMTIAALVTPRSMVTVMLLTVAFAIPTELVAIVMNKTSSRRFRM